MGGMNNKSTEGNQEVSIIRNNDDVFIPKKSKEKKRSNEKRKEKSRDAARCRRSRETEIFTELAHILPLRREDVDQLDKASIMRLSIAFLKIREVLKLFPKLKDIKIENKSEDKNNDDKKELFEMLNGPELSKLLANVMDGFLTILSNEGDVIYVSENISEYLGISQIDILGQQIWEYSHQCDHDELKEALNMRRNPVSNDIKYDDNKKQANNKDNKNLKNLKTAHRDFYMRFKCTLTSRGRNVNIKSASYKVIHMTGHIIQNDDGERVLVAVGRPLPHPSNIEIPLGSTTFLTKHSLDMKFTYVDDKMLSLLGYRPENLLGKSVYDFHYAGDSESLMATFRSVVSKGQGETNRYRFLGKYGGYSWVVTQATIVYDKQKPQSVVCVNYAISDLENDNEIYSYEQLEAINKKKEELIKNQYKQQQQQQQHQQQQEQEPQKIQQQKKSDNLLEQQQQQQKSTISVQSVQNKLPSSATGIIVENINEKFSTKTPALLKSCYQRQKIQQEENQQQQQLQEQSSQNQQQQKQISSVTTTTPNKTEAIKCENRIYRENSLSPIRRTFNKCTISSPNILPSSSSSLSASVNNNCVTKQSEYKGPKSVTASVFKKISLPSTKFGFSNSLNNTVTKPQSVTASVFTSISNLQSNKNIQEQNNLFASDCSNKTKNNIFKNLNITNKTPTEQEQNRQIQRSEDMNKGFSMFLDDPPELTMLKEEPDDLTHLAPSAGDTCIPLDDSTPLFGEMLDGLILPDSYGTLLSDDINSLDSQQSNNNSNNNNCNNNNNNNSNKSHIDPFINYRDESSDTTGSPHLLSPGASKSPEVSSIPSLCSPHSLSQEDEFAFMTMNDEIDLTMRAPYIPMNEQEDLPLLTEDLMWSAFTEELHKDIKESMQIEIKNNSTNNGLNENSLSSSTTITNSNNNNHNNNTNSSSNCNDVNSESSLAALLCSSIHHQQAQSQSQQQQQQQKQQNQHDQQLHLNGQHQEAQALLLGQINNETSKKRKFELTDNATDLVDSVGAFGQVFNKNLSSMDCWTINDLLQISPTLTSTSNVATSLSQADTKQSVIVNTAIPTTFHVPLIALQHNGNKINLTRSSSIGSLNHSKTTKSDGGLGGGGIVVEDQCNKKLNMTKILTTPTSTSTAGIIKQSSNINTCNINEIGNTVACNKRHLNVSTSLDPKRVKNSPSVEIQTSPQLLQQLMAPSPQKQKTKSLLNKSQNSRWSPDGGGGGDNQTQGNNGTSLSSSSSSSSSSSNSVLKNLLVSGCDGSFSSCPPNISMTDESNRHDSIQKNDQQLLSPGLINNNYYAKPLQCAILNNGGIQQQSNFLSSNPMIGGPGILPSPPIPVLPGTEYNMTIDDNNCNSLNGQNYGNEKCNQKITPSNTFLLLSSKLLSTFNDSDSDSGIECNSDCNSRRNSFGFPTRSISKINTTMNDSNKIPILNPIRKVELPPNLDVYRGDDDSMSVSDDESPPPLESAEMLPSTLLSASSLASPIKSCTPSPSFMNSTCNDDDCNGNSDNAFDSSQFIMDLCSNDYAMTDLLQDNEITKVLSEWNSEMT